MTIRGIAVVLLAAGCNAFNHTSAQVQAPHVMVATVLSTPQIVVKPEALAGWDGGLFGFDGGLPDFDGGFPFDGGFTFDGGGFSFDGGLVIPAQTAIVAFFGMRMGTDLTQAPQGVSGATLTAATPDKTWTLKDQGSGSHVLTSQDDATLKYEPGATYTFTAAADNQQYVGDVENAPGGEMIFQLHPDAGFIELAAGSPYELTRPDPPPGQSKRDLGFVSVFPVNAQGQQGNPTYTNVPMNPLEFLKLAAAPSMWQQTVITIPGTAFPEANANYIILLQTAKLGGASSDNLFIGSPMIAGAADVGVVKTH